MDEQLDGKKDVEGSGEWLRTALSPAVSRRALKMALIVGSVLLIINHGDALLSGHISLSRLLRMLLTVVVPYVVSTVSSAGAILEMRHAAPASPVSPVSDTLLKP
jgi:hypothetical protein